MRIQILVLAVCAALVVGCNSGGGGSTPPSSGTGGGAPNIDLTSTAIGFGSVGVGSNASQTVTVSNAGTAALTLGTITAPAVPFSRTGGTCANGQILAVNASCTIILQYTPASAVASSGSFNITSNDPDAGTTNGQNNVVVNLSGTGFAMASYFYYSGVSSASSTVGGLLSVGSATPAVPSTVDNNALANDFPPVTNAKRSKTVEAGTMDASTGNISNYRTYAVVFAAGGKLWKQYADQAPGPVQISNVTSITAGLGNGAAGSSATDLCNLNIVPDFAHPENSIIIYGLAGANASCGDSDDTYAWLRLNINTSTAPTALTVLPVAPVYSSAGAITHILAIDGFSALVKLDADFGASTTIAAGPFVVAKNDQDIWVTHLSPTRVLLHLPPAGAASAAGQLRIVDAGTNTITDSRGTIANRAAWSSVWSPGAYNYDSSHVYFVGNDVAGTPTGVIQRFPVDGSVAATTFYAAGAVQVDVLHLTTSSVVYHTSGVSPSIVSIPKAGGAPVPLANGAPGESVYPYGVSSTGYVYYDRLAGSPPNVSSSDRAETIKDDGTGHVTYGASNGAQWSGFHRVTAFNVYRGDRDLDQLVVAEYAAAATTMAGATLSVVSAGTTAKDGTVVGTVPAGIQGIYGFVIGTRGLWEGYDGDQEIFYVDTAAPGSLTRITTDTVNQQLIQ